MPSLKACLKNLKTIHLENVTIETAKLAAEIAEMPVLRKIFIRDCGPSPPRSWKAILQAIHHHSKPMAAYLNVTSLRGKLFIAFPWLEPTTHVADGAALKWDFDEALFAYLASAGPWTQQLEKSYA
jgi:hypothetical protein